MQLQRGVVDRNQTVRRGALTKPVSLHQTGGDMLKGLTGLLVAFMLLAVAPQAQANEWRAQHCRYNKGAEAWSPFEIRQTIRCAVDKWNVPGGVPKAINVADCESSLYWKAVSESGTYKGVYQQSKHYWPERQRNAPDWLDLAPGIFNGRSNVIVSILMARGGWSPWAGCA